MKIMRRLKRRVSIPDESGFNELPEAAQRGIIRKLALIADATNPYAPLKKKRGQGWALHCGKYRVFVKIEPGEIVVSRASHRRDAYPRDH